MNIDDYRLKQEARKKDFTSPCIYSKDCKQADGIGCTHTRHPDNVAKRRAEEKAKEIHIEAYDTVGRTFDKIVTIKENSGVPIRKRIRLVIL